MLNTRKLPLLLYFVSIFLIASDCIVKPAAAEQIHVGNKRRGWSPGGAFPDLKARVGDELIFEMKKGTTDVYMLPSKKCAFKARRSELLAESTEEEAYVHTFRNTGTYYFGSSVKNQCADGMLFQVVVSKPLAPPSPPPPPPTLPFIGNSIPTDQGYCSDPLWNGSKGEFRVSCLSQPIILTAGQNYNTNLILPNPYPSEIVSLQTLSTQIVDNNQLRPVPLDEVYVHHVFGDPRVFPIGGSEMRGSPLSDTPLPSPYGILINGADVEEEPAMREVNIQLINTVGVGANDLTDCIECRCSGPVDSPVPTGSIGCCQDCPSTKNDEPPRIYRYQYNVTYQPLWTFYDMNTDAIQVSRATMLQLDMHGGVEYTVVPKSETLQGKLPKSLSKLDVYTTSFPFDHFCPQTKRFKIIRCVAHQHIGGKCISLYNSKTDRLICQSCPITGTGAKGEVGNEEGFVVGVDGGDPFEYEMKPGQRVYATAAYKADRVYAGAQSLLTVTVADFDTSGCDINWKQIIQPPSMDADGVLKEKDMPLKLSNRISEVPSTCGTAASFLQQVVRPCLASFFPSINPEEQLVTSQSLSATDISTMDDKKCCTEVANFPSGIYGLLQAFMDAGALGGDCSCPLGELLKLINANSLLSKDFLGMFDRCSTPENLGNFPSVYGLAGNVLHIAVNSYFAPTCPSLFLASTRSYLPTGGNRPEVLLALTQLKDEDTKKMASGVGWEKARKQLYGFWLNLSKTNIDYARGIIAETPSKRGIIIHNFGRTNVSKLRLDTLKGMDLDIIGAAMVHQGYDRKMKRSERLEAKRWKWSAGDITAGKAELSSLGFKYGFPLTRANVWLNDPMRPPYNGVLLSGDGAVYEIDPIKFLKEPHHRVAFPVFISTMRQLGKPAIWLAPLGSSKRYLSHIQKVYGWMKSNNSLPDVIVITKYGENKDGYPVLPETNDDGKPANTLTGTVLWLQEQLKKDFSLSSAG